MCVFEQVLKKHLSFNMPTILCGDYMYEEGEGLEEDELKMYFGHLPKKLVDLPGGGIRDGSIVDVQDQSQQFSVKIIISHKTQVREGTLL